MIFIKSNKKKFQISLFCLFSQCDEYSLIPDISVEHSGQNKD